jgi:O-antigen/teichoic acid export membrane protein
MNAMQRDSAVRLAATVVSVAAGAVAAVITARWLGPSGKGVVALLTLLGLLLTRVAVLSLGEAAVVLVGKRRVERSHAIGVVLATSVMTSLVAALVFAAAAIALVDPDSDSVWIAVAIGCVSIPVFVYADVFGQLLLLDSRVIRSSLAFAISSIVTLIGTVVFVVPLDLGIPGAMGGTALGGAAGAAAAVRMDLLARPRRDRRVLRQALAYGVPAEAGVVLTQAAARLDLLVVFAIVGSASAGIYSVALTIGALVGLVPSAIAFAAFPRLAQVRAQPTATVARLGRLAGLGGFLSAILIGFAAAIGIPVLFGDEFSSATAPSLILIGAGVIWGVQWTLARATAALGDPRLLLSSFGTALVVMLALDALLVPTAETTGAAAASAVGSVAGLAVCLRHLRAQGLGPAQLIPGPEDFGAFIRVATSVGGDLRRLSSSS